MVGMYIQNDTDLWCKLNVKFLVCMQLIILCFLLNTINKHWILQFTQCWLWLFYYVLPFWRSWLHWLNNKNILNLTLYLCKAELNFFNRNTGSMVFTIFPCLIIFFSLPFMVEVLLLLQSLLYLHLHPSHFYSAIG